jgi:hypothetical protein
MLLLPVLEAALAGAPTVELRDPERLVHLAATTRTESVIGYALDEGHVRADRWAADLLVGALELQERRNRELLQELCRVGDRFAAAGVAAVRVRKGAVACRMYPRIGARPFNDLDLVVDIEDGGAVLDALRLAGYAEVSTSRHQRTRYMIATGGFLPLGRVEPNAGSGARSFQIDVMRSVLPPQFAAGDFERQQLGALGEEVAPRIFALSDHAAVLDTCTSLLMTSVTAHYIRRRRFRRLNLYLDLLIYAQRGFDPVAIARDAGADGAVLDAVAFSVGNLRQLFPSVGLDVWDAEVAQRGGRRLLDVVGYFELAEPVTWSASLLERVFGDPPVPNVMDGVRSLDV